jgi:hypothetical protein
LTVNSNNITCIASIELNRIKTYFETLINSNNNLELMIHQFKGESVHAFFTINLLEADGRDTKQCKLCLKKIQLNKMRLNVAQHILLQKEEERKSNTCGFCGGSSCLTKQVVTSGSGERTTY